MIMKFKIFETWNDNTIDRSLFVSGRAKHNPKVINNAIEYETDDGKFFATIKQIGMSKFLCKVYKYNDDGEKKRIRKKIKRTLKTAHNFIREVLNDRVEKNEEEPEEEPIGDDIPDESEYEFEPIPDMPPEYFEPQEYQEPKPKTIIRRFN